MKTLTKLFLKPYELVVVEEEGYSYIGEVISYETPENTIMVRRVPNDPSTMVEMPVAKLKGVTGRYSHIHYAAVHGRGRFPIDMLRYDWATPVSFTLDSEGYPVLNKGETKLIIATVSHPTRTWTPARWNSFSWGIAELKTLKYVKGK